MDLPQLNPVPRRIYSQQQPPAVYAVPLDEEMDLAEKVGVDLGSPLGDTTGRDQNVLQHRGSVVTCSWEWLTNCRS